MLCIYIDVYIYIYTYMYLDVNICRNTHMYTHMYMHIYMYVYMHAVEGLVICSANSQHIHLIAPNDKKTTCHATHMNESWHTKPL